MSQSSNQTVRHCVGKTRISNGIWYVPHGKATTECTYCEFCVNNGCISLHEVTKVDGKLNNCNCDCPNQGSHVTLEMSMVNLRCPVCRVKQIGMLSSCTCGSCKQCHNYTPNPGYTYCMACSNRLTSCEKCGKKIKSGNEYLEGIKKSLDKKIKQHQDQLDRQRTSETDGYGDQSFWKSMDDSNRNSVKKYEEMYEKLRPEYENKTSDEMLQVLLDKSRE